MSESKELVMHGIELAVLGDLHVGGKLRDSQIIKTTPVGLDLPDGMNQQRWEAIGWHLKLVKHAYHFCMADWISYGRKNFGNEIVDSALQQLEFDLPDVQKANAILELPRGERRIELTPEHHYVVGKNEKLSAEQREDWLKKAAENDLTAVELQRSIEAGKIVRDTAERGRNSGIATIEGLMMWFENWRSKVEKKDPIMAWPPDRKKQWLEKVNPIVQLAEEVRKSLE